MTQQASLVNTNNVPAAAPAAPANPNPQPSGSSGRVAGLMAKFKDENKAQATAGSRKVNAAAQGAQRPAAPRGSNVSAIINRKFNAPVTPIRVTPLLELVAEDMGLGTFKKTDSGELRFVFNPPVARS